MIKQDYQLSKEAVNDLRGIIRYTRTKHGEAQVLKYVAQLENCAKKLAKSKDKLQEMRSIHQSLRYKHCGHHYIFGLNGKSGPILIIAILHERMDLIARLKSRL
jgi:plasmid stabilization system protein ParE